MQSIDILCVGEVLIDFIGHQENAQINTTRDYHRYLGGSPTNVAMNAARLGLKSSLVATVGEDGFGDYMTQRLDEAGVGTALIRRDPIHPSSVIFISKTSDTPEFIPYRSSDFLITENQVPDAILEHSKIFHTTCFALSKDPARSTILSKAKKAADMGCKTSIDVNYSEKLWDNVEEAFDAIRTYCELNPLVKISQDDMFRLFQKEISHGQIFDFFHGIGVETVCLTLGSKGVKLSSTHDGIIELPAKKVARIKDATGAGDAFWSGFLYAYLNQKTTEECLDIALKLAALKLQNVGRLPDNINVLSKLLQ